MMIRVWRGWTPLHLADRYEELLKSEVFPAIAAKAVSGYHGVELFRTQCPTEVEFMTIMHFDSIEAVREFAGEDYERAYVPQAARDLLSRYEEDSRHYEPRLFAIGKAGNVMPYGATAFGRALK